MNEGFGLLHAANAVYGSTILDAETLGAATPQAGEGTRLLAVERQRLVRWPPKDGQPAPRYGPAMQPSETD